MNGPVSINPSNNQSPRLPGDKSQKSDKNNKSRMSIFSLNVSRENKEAVLNMANNAPLSAGQGKERAKV